MRGAMMTASGPGTPRVRCSHAAMTGGFRGGVIVGSGLGGLGGSAATSE